MENPAISRAGTGSKHHLITEGHGVSPTVWLMDGKRGDIHEAVAAVRCRSSDMGPPTTNRHSQEVGHTAARSLSTARS
ncbi:hypothetical protein [Lentzea jiangxiensis]|uniref:hypothetical protein n=1 Tax=Lentzea jiangxiensis TaxID=641025 RepID=UPI000B7DFC14|nr:hypothetical protein [Lentzea jiangxiensis]